MLAVNSVFAAGLLTVTANAADNVAITSAAGNVLINGVNPGSGAATAASVTAISVTATGAFTNTLDLSGVTAADFTALPATGAVTVNSGPGDDTIIGSDVGDLLIVGGGFDDLTGNDGDDIFDLSGANASVNPGGGTDTIRYIVTNPAGETVMLSATATERLEITGGAGADNLTVSGGAQVFIVTGGGGTDTINASGITNANAQVTLNGGAGNDTITGGAAGDLIIGGGDFDDMTGNDGDDIFDLSGGNALVDPGNGTDTIRYIVTNPAGETVALTATATERLEVTGGAGADNITVDGGAQVFIVTGGGSGDTINGGGITNANAQVTLDGGAGNDTITGGAAGDRIIDGAGDDSLIGGAGNDTYVLTPGSADVIDDTGGDDTADFSGAALGITINMDSAAVQVVNTNGDTVDLNGQIENFIGSPQNDTVTVAPLGVTRTMSGGGNGGAPGDRLTTTATSTTIGVTATSFSIGGTINYDTFESVSLTGTAGDDTITVTATPAATALTIDGIGGSDDYIVSQSGVSTAGLTLSDTGAVGNDDLILNGAAVDTITYNHTNASSGSIVIDPDGPGGAGTSTIAFSGFEPIVNSGTATNIVFNLTAGADTATLSDLGGGMSRLASAGSFEMTDFVNPTAGGSLTINGGDGVDAITIASLDAPFDGTLAIDGQGGASNSIVVTPALFIGGGLGLSATTISINTGTIDTGANQTYVGGVAISTPLTATTGTAGQISFSSSVAAAGNDLTLTADEINFGAANTVSGSGIVTLQRTTSAPGTAIAVGGAADLGAAFLDITDGDIAALADGFSEIRIGRSDGQHTIGVASATFKDTVTIRAPGAAGNVSVDQQLDTLASLDAANITITAPTVTLNDDVVTAGGVITITATSIVLGTNPTVALDSTNASASTGANITVTGTINDDVLPTSLAVSAGTVGDVTLSGAIGAVTPIDALTVSGNDISLGAIGGGAAGATGATTVTAANIGGDTGSITLTGTTYNANAQTYNAGGATNAIQFAGGAAGSTTSVTSSADAITFTGAVDLNGRDLTISTGGGAVTFNNTINGTGDLTINSGVGTITLGGAVGVGTPLTSLTTDAGGTTVIAGGAVTTTGDQSYGDNVVVNLDTTLTAANLSIAGTLNSEAGEANDVLVTVSGTTTFFGVIGGAPGGALGTLQTNGGGSTIFGSDGAAVIVLFDEPLVLNESATISATTATFAGTVNSQVGENNNLTVTTTGVTSFAAAIGGTTPLGNLTVTAGGPFTFVANATTTAAIDIAVPDAAAADHISQNAGTTVRSTGGSIRYRAGDNITLAATAVLDAATTLTIEGDFGDNDAGGSVIDLLGTVDGTTITITSGNDNDTIRLSNSPAAGATTITADLGDDTIDLGSTTNSLDTLLGPITVTGGGNVAGDALNLNDQGDGGLGNDYDLSSTQFSRNAIAPVSYSGIETLTMRTSTGADDIVVALPAIIATPLPGTVRLFGGTGRDVVRYNGSADADTLSYSDIGGAAQHRLSGIDCSVVVGGAGADTINNLTAIATDLGVAVPSAMDLGTGDDRANGAGNVDVIYGAGGREVDINAGAGNDFVFPDHDAMRTPFIVANEGAGLTIDGGAGFDRGVFLTNGLGDTIAGFESGVFDGANINDVIMWLRAQFLPGSAAGSVLLLAEAAKCANWHHNYTGTDLGNLATQSIASVDPSSEDVWYEFHAAQTGQLMARATYAAGDGAVELTAFDDMLTEIDSAWSASGTTTLATNVVAGGHYYFRVRSVNPNVALSLSIGQPMPGDLNLDGQVSIVDLTALQQAMGSTSAAFDLNGDGIVSAGDLAYWVSHYFGSGGSTAAPAPAAASAVVAHQDAGSAERAHAVDQVFAAREIIADRPSALRRKAATVSAARSNPSVASQNSGAGGQLVNSRLLRAARTARARFAGGL
jgi:Ca2+-binding RTX toxin-like protein